MAVEVFEWYEQSGNYRISWASVKGELVYTAWHRQPWHGFGWAPLGYYREGAEADRLTAARTACREHWQMTNGRVADGTG